MPALNPAWARIAPVSEPERFLHRKKSRLTKNILSTHIDCGGVEYVIIRYGSFFEFVMPIKNGHVSVGIEPHSDIMEINSKIQNTVKASGF